MSYADWSFGSAGSVHRHVEDGVEVYAGPPEDCPICVYPLTVATPGTTDAPSEADPPT